MELADGWRYGGLDKEIRMSRYDSWLESGAHDGEDEEIYREERIPELLNDECNPCYFDNFVDAIADDALVKSIQQIEKAMAEGNMLELGNLIMSAVCAYWEDSAERKVQREIESGAYLD